MSRNLRFDELRKVLESYGYEMRQPSGGCSHCTFRKPGCAPITIPILILFPAGGEFRSEFRKAVQNPNDLLLHRQWRDPASFEVEPVPEAPTFTLPPLPEQDEPKKPKRRIPWGWLAAAVAVIAFFVFALPPLKRTAEANRQQIAAQQAAEQEKREQEEQRAEQARLEEEAEQLRQQEEREAALQAEKDAGIPYVGMLENSIDSTRTLGTHGMAKSGWAYKKDGTFKQMTYYWCTNNRTPIFTAVCQDGKVIETQKINGYWSGNRLLVPVVKPVIPTTFHSGSSGSIREDYDNPEDLYEDNRDWYDDEDEAWDEWENG